MNSHFKVHLTLSLIAISFFSINSVTQAMPKWGNADTQTAKKLYCFIHRYKTLYFPLDVQSASQKKLTRTFKIWPNHQPYCLLTHKNLNKWARDFVKLKRSIDPLMGSIDMLQTD